MSAVSSSRILDTWEQGLGRPAIDRALLLLRLTDDTRPVNELACLRVGAADRRLLDLRETLFGSRFEAVCRCPRCEETLELGFSTADLRAGETGEGDENGPRELSVDHHRVIYRAPQLHDLAAAAAARDPESAREQLLTACVLSADCAGHACAPHELPEPVVTALGAALEAADPQACNRLELHCPACGEAWSSVFDIAEYLWQEIHTWAQGVLREVHALASAYGWTEPEILALSPSRRRCYLELLAR